MLLSDWRLIWSGFSIPQDKIGSGGNDFLRVAVSSFAEFLGHKTRKRGEETFTGKSLSIRNPLRQLPLNPNKPSLFTVHTWTPWFSATLTAFLRDFYSTTIAGRCGITEERKSTFPGIGSSMRQSALSKPNVFALGWMMISPNLQMMTHNVGSRTCLPSYYPSVKPSWPLLKRII